MGFGTKQRNSTSRYHHRRLPPNVLRQRAFGGALLVSVSALCAWTICGNLAGQIDIARTRGDKLVIPKPSSSASNVHAFLFDPRSFLPRTFASSAPLQRDGSPLAPVASHSPSLAAAQNMPMASHDERVAQRAVLPAPRPASAPSRNASFTNSEHGTQTASDTPAAGTSIFAMIFEKVFGKPTSVKLAYAATDDGGLGVGQITVGRYDRWTAVYDISTHTVYMPDGTQLEAHSGLGSVLDDPRHADEKMRGVTPPNVYDLELREEPFHGVRALKMIPEDEGKTFGRTGFLAHTFMLGPNGDSNGCVSFRNYDAFLQAYLDHKIKRLAVVTSL